MEKHDCNCEDKPWTSVKRKPKNPVTYDQFLAQLTEILHSYGYTSIVSGHAYLDARYRYRQRFGKFPPDWINSTKGLGPSGKWEGVGHRLHATIARQALSLAMELGFELPETLDFLGDENGW